jgi:hypothetical protein
VNPDHLSHVSEESRIAVFHPRPVQSPDVGPDCDCVWAIEHGFLANYLVPRDCPRVIYRRVAAASAADAELFDHPQAQCASALGDHQNPEDASQDSMLSAESDALRSVTSS